MNKDDDHEHDDDDDDDGGFGGGVDQEFFGKQRIVNPSEKCDRPLSSFHRRKCVICWRW